jgi:Glycosyltransferase 61
MIVGLDRMVRMQGKAADFVPETITTVNNALAVPASRTSEGPVQHTVVDLAGAPVADAMTTGNGKAFAAEFVDRRKVHPTSRLDGRYMFGGVFWHHFGHFLFETITRLWAFPGLRDQLDGIVFFQARKMEDTAPMHSSVLEILGIDLPIILIDGATEIEQLYVPRQGCGYGGLVSGTPAFRQFMHDRLHRIEPVNPGSRLYVSREGYGLRRGGYLAEEVLRTRLETEGYTAYSPEKHSFREQVATYLGATHILGPDSSAMHLVGFSVTAATQVGLILRRLHGDREMLPQITGFTGRAPDVIDAITRMYRRDNMKNPTWSLLSEIDMAEVGRQLTAAGFIAGLADWSAIGPEEQDRLIAACRERFQCDLITIWARDTPGTSSPILVGEGLDALQS